MKKVKINKMGILVLFACIVTAFSFLKSSAVSSQKNEIKTNPDTKYQITYELNGGQFEGEYPKTFKISQETAIPNPIKDGSEFLGWTINDNTNIAPVKDYKIPEMTQGDVKLTANWKSKYNMLVDGQTFNSKIKNFNNYVLTKALVFEKVNSIVDVKNKNDYIDVSEAQDGSIIAYYTKQYYNGGVLTLAQIHIVSESEIFANQDSSYMFYKFEYLTGINLNNFNTSQVTNMERMFEDCYKLISLDLTNFDTSEVKNMNYMFSFCTSITKIVGLENWNTSQVSNMRAMFNNCKKITNLDVNNFDTSNVTNMGYIFNDCNLLTELDLSNWNTSNNIYLTQIFYNCYSLTYLDLSKWDTDRVTHIQHMLANCTNLIKVKGLESLDFSKISYWESAFDNCKKLSAEITINNISNNYDYIFRDCSTNPNAKFIVKYISPETKEVARQMVATKSTNSNVFLYEEPATLMAGEQFNSTVLGMSGFENVEEIRFIKGTPNSNGIDVSEAQDGTIKAYIEGTILTVSCEGEIMANSDCSKMFLNINSLRSLDVRELNTSKVNNMSSMFHLCESLNTIIGIETFNTSKVTDMRNMFYRCISLTSLDLSKWDTSQVTNMYYMFRMCYKLNGEITIMNHTIESNNYLGMFEYCSTELNNKFIVNYILSCRDIAQAMVDTKFNGNVILGIRKSLLNEDIPNNEEASVSDTVVLTIKDGNTTTTKETLTGEIGSLNIPSKEGMIFSGYFYDIEYTKPVSERDVISEDTTIYIKWEEVPQVDEIPQDENKDESLEVA